MAGFTVTDAGFSVPRLPEARARVVELWRGVYGEDARTDSACPDGLMIDTIALLLALSWQGSGASSSNAYLRQSRGVFVDRCLDIFARRRLTARASTASLVLYGTDATVVPSGTQARTAVGGVFGTDAAATIGSGDLVWVVRVDTIANSVNYAITVDAVVSTYSADGSATRDEIVDGLIAELAGDGTTAYDGGDDADGRARIVVESDTAIAVSSGARLTTFPAVRVAATATATGVIQALATTIATINTPVSGLVGVTNTADAVVGRAVETDQEFKARHWATLSANAARSPDAIAARLMSESGPDGVEIARVYENESSVPVGLRPAHSFETFVLGGDDDEIAELIWSQKPMGIAAYGTTTVNVRGADGRLHPIGFTRPTVLYLHLRVTVVGGEGYPSSGTPLTTIRDAIASWLGDGGGGELQLGQDFYRFSLGQPVAAAVPGIVSLAIETDTTAAPGDIPTFSSADITVAEGEILRSDASRIEVL
jgi:hypothetical protein